MWHSCLQAAISQLSLLVHTLPTEQLAPETAAALEHFTGGPASAGVHSSPMLMIDAGIMPPTQCHYSCW